MAYSIEIANVNSDREAIIKFWRENLPGWAVGKYPVFYENNPAGKGICWLARIAGSNDIVGATALFPRKLDLGGKSCLAAIAGDLGVDKNHRAKGIAGTLQQALAAYVRNSEIEFVYGTANPISEKVLRQAGYQVIGKTVRMVKVLQSKRYFTKTKLLAPLTNSLATGFDWLQELKSPEHHKNLPKRFGWERIEGFDKRFDNLWQRATDSFLITGERSSKFLNWRFAYAGYKSFKTFALIDNEKKQLLAYIVYQLIGKDVHIEDILAVNGISGIEVLLTAFLKRLRKENIETISFYFFGNQQVIDFFRQFGFSLRKDYRTMAILIDKNHKYKQTILNPDNWFFLHADNDVDA